MARASAVKEAPGVRPNVWDPDDAPGSGTDVDVRNETLVRHMALVRFCAKRVAQSFGLPPGVELGDLISHGLLGLIEAHERYEPTRGVTFETFAIPRIRGAILDELRRYDWVPRNVRARARKMNEAMSTLAARHGRTPTREELAQSLGVSDVDAFERISVPARLLGLDDLVRVAEGASEQVAVGDVLVDPDAEVPGSALEEAERRESLARALAELAERERLVLTLHYFESVSLAEIARLLNVTESRVSQLHTRALHALQSRMRDD